MFRESVEEWGLKKNLFWCQNFWKLYIAKISKERMENVFCEKIICGFLCFLAPKGTAHLIPCGLLFFSSLQGVFPCAAVIVLATLGSVSKGELSYCWWALSQIWKALFNNHVFTRSGLHKLWLCFTHFRFVANLFFYTQRRRAHWNMYFFY